MSTTVQEQKSSKWQSFVSLIWLDGTINFIFRLVAKTSELLLAIGIIISAADFLTDGRLMHNNLVLSDAWAWTQAIAIESSSGVVLMYALQAFKEKDKIKGWLYLILATLLALVGGVMLLTQIILSTTGINLVTQGALWFIVGIAIARTVVSIAYVVMCRIKHIRFSGLIAETDSTPAPTIDIKSMIDEAVSAAIDSAMLQLQSMQERQFDIAIQEVKRTVIEEVTQHKLIAIPKEAISRETPKTSRVVDSKPSNIDRLSIAKNALVANPSIKDAELANLLQASSINTARSWKKKALAEMER
jgi:hypothetical protein